MGRHDGPPCDAPAVDGVSRTLATVFPPAVAVAAAAVGTAHEVQPEEHAAVAHAAPARRDQFLAGRACAHVALSAIGRDVSAVRQGPTRAPEWPPGTVGSIAHTATVACAVVAATADAWGVGVDLEPLDPPLDPGVERLVLAADELADDRPDGHPLAPFLSKIAFCAKECVYKCVSPSTGWSLEFHDVLVRVDLERGRYTAAVDERFRVDGAPLPLLQGRFAVAGGMLVAGLHVAAHGLRRSGPRKR